MRILLIDDDLDDQAIFSDAVKSVDSSMLLYCANNGEEGLNRLKNSIVLPEAIFLDVNMPVMNGRECLAEIKADMRLRDIKITMYSTSNAETEKNVFKAMGADFMTKPTCFKELVKMLSEYLVRNECFEEIGQMAND
jgi:CheY-like chemotaxis protein